ncbi:MAG: UbiD family decarboxylase [Coriobacteriia bacterium]|nr:UbiD family decarboxylase [Coriobacteriia bacterium]
MAMQSLREYLEVLDKNAQLVTISDEVMPEPELRQYLRAASNLTKSGPALLFDNIKGYKGKRMAGAVSASWASYALMLGLEKEASELEMFHNIKERWKKKDISELVWVDNPPCQEIVYDKDINLYEILPLFRINPGDGGFYCSKASVITQDPDDPDSLELENVGMYRIQVQEPDTIGAQIGLKSQGNIPLAKARARGEEFKMAILLGPPPFVSAMSCAGIPYNQSEYKIAAALMGEPLQMAKCLTSNIDIPAHTEVVLECTVMPEKYMEGPFGEYPGSYSGSKEKLSLKVDRVTCRRDPIFENLYIGKSWTEHDTIVGPFTSVPVYMELIDRFPEVKAVNANFNHGISLVVAVDQRFCGFSKTVGLAVIATTHGLEYAKNIILVDGDINPFDMNAVMWALSFRLEHKTDIIVLPNMKVSALDPSGNPRGLGTRLILDATTPKLPETFGYAGVPNMTEPIPNVLEFEKRILALQSRLSR